MGVHFHLPSLAKTALLAGTVFLGTAAGATSQQRIDLPAQDLGKTLKMLGSATGISIIFDPAAVATQRAPALRGTYATEEALRILLRNSGLSFTAAPGGIYVVSPPVIDNVNDLDNYAISWKLVARPSDAININTV